MTMRKRFVLGMVIYALVFLALTAVGLKVLWDFIDAYEQSRPMNTVKAYVSSVTTQDMWDGSEALLDTLDENVRSRDDSRALIAQAASGTLSYAKKSGESTEERQVYVLRSGRQVIGQFAITAGEPDKYGFRVWSVTESSFDFSYLVGQPVSVTVPSDFPVSVNGVVLDASYITESGHTYSILEEFYDDYTLPTLVTYTVDSFLGEVTLDVADREGNPITITGETDYNVFLPECSQDAQEELDPFVEGFLGRYVTFTSSANSSASGNYARLLKYLVKGSDLANRLYTAIDGLQFAQSNGDLLENIQVNQYADLDDGRYLCDVTYLVKTWGKKGAVETVNNLRLIIVETSDGLKVEAMTRY